MYCLNQVLLKNEYIGHKEEQKQELSEDNEVHSYKDLQTMRSYVLSD